MSFSAPSHTYDVCSMFCQNTRCTSTPYRWVVRAPGETPHSIAKVCSIRKLLNSSRVRCTIPQHRTGRSGGQQRLAKNGLMPSESDQRRHDEAHFGRLEVTGVKSGAGVVFARKRSLQTSTSYQSHGPEENGDSNGRTSGSSSSIGRARGRLMPNHLRSS